MNDRHLSSISEEMLEAIEADLKLSTRLDKIEPYRELISMIDYHMGWEKQHSSMGKRIRPLLLLLCCDGVGGIWQKAIPAASAIELIHNFSLIHDDIQDQSELRRGRPTVWKRWGVAQAINAGDAMFTLAHLASYRLFEEDIPHETTKEVIESLSCACLQLTQGQFLDLLYETQVNVSPSAYLEMIEGKTSALISTAAFIGARIGGAPTHTATSYLQFGHHLGLAFQILDDILGIWGAPEVTGKPMADDLNSRKKTLPILIGIERSPAFAKLWAAQKNESIPVGKLFTALDQSDARDRARDTAYQHTEQALAALEAANPQGETGKQLKHLTQHLLNRQY